MRRRPEQAIHRVLIGQGPLRERAEQRIARRLPYAALQSYSSSTLVTEAAQPASRRRRLRIALTALAALALALGASLLPHRVTQRWSSGTLVRFEGPPASPRGEMLRVVVIDLEGATTTPWRSPADDGGPEARLRWIAREVANYKVDTIVLLNAPQEPIFDGAKAAIEFVASNTELYWFATRTSQRRWLAWRRPWREGPGAVLLGESVASSRSLGGLLRVEDAPDGVALVFDGGVRLTAHASGDTGPPRVTLERAKLLRTAQTGVDGLLRHPAWFGELARLAPDPARP
jgi:hypothetical protein